MKRQRLDARRMRSMPTTVTVKLLSVEDLLL